MSFLIWGIKFNVAVNKCNSSIAKTIFSRKKEEIYAIAIHKQVFRMFDTCSCEFLALNIAKENTLSL